ncbi:hypothetical protein SO802_023320 [Lithocarpus litseifolius]|uniref:Reverse transcriptase n=1 Tax=Lithocarpus litseifolius TaxID=425828 RepID=A0AAW2C8G3_9ROSI
MEYLGHLIEEKCAAKIWRPVKASRNGPSFSHLFFADDLVLFAGADSDNCHAINAVLYEFCSRFRQRVSEAKSCVFFSPNVKPDQRDLLSNTLGFNSTSNLDKYLGFPLKHIGDRKFPWNILFPFAVWMIWKHRNQAVFANKGTNPNLTKVISMQASKFLLCATQPTYYNRMVFRQIRWEKPELGWLKLNTDGSSNGVVGTAAGGGLIRDEFGNWVIGFSRRIRRANSFAAEI